MTTEYVYNGEKFIVSKPEDCTMKVTKDGCTAVISVGKTPGKYHVASQDGSTTGLGNDVESALSTACFIIQQKLARIPTKDELCSGLDTCYHCCPNKDIEGRCNILF